MSQQQKIYEDMRRRIMAGEFAGTDSLPSLRDLAQHYQSSTGTVRLAMIELEQNKLIFGRHGAGYFISSEMPEPNLKRVILIEHSGNEHLYSNFVREFQNCVMADGKASLTVVHPETGGCREKFLSYLEAVGAYDDAIVFYNAEHLKFMTSDDMHKLSRNSKVYYYFNRKQIAESLLLPGVAIDWYGGTYLAVRYLTEIGCRNLLVIGGNGRLLDGCRDSAEDAGVAVSFAQNREEAAALLRQHSFDGIFSTSDSILVQLFGELRDLGRIPGRDVALVGFYNTPWCETCEPILSSMSIREEEIVRTVWAMANGDIPEKSEMLRPRLIVRNSTTDFNQQTKKDTLK